MGTGRARLCKPRGGRFLAEALRGLGIRHVFSIPGSQILSVWDALARVRGPELVVPRSEWNGAFLAEGYGRACGEPAVVMNTLGPGVANEVVGMFSAREGCAPVLFVSPCHPPAKRERFGRVFQGMDQRRFFEAIPRANHSVDRAEDLGRALRTAFEECLGPPAGPVRVEISFPLLFERHDFGPVPSRARGEPIASPRAIVVCEAPPFGADAPDRLGLRRDQCLVISPGLGEPGHAVPCALGARFARPDVPAIALTTVERLIDNADSVSLARFHDVPLNLILRGPADDGNAKALADLFGASYCEDPSDEELRGILLEGPPALSIVCPPGRGREPR